MRQQNNKTFYNLPTRARKKLLDNNDIDTLKSGITSSFSINDINKNVVIVQWNATKYIINRLQIKSFAQANR